MTTTPKASPVSWGQARAFRLRRMHLVDRLGPRSLRRVARDLGGIQAQVHSAAELQCAARMDGLSREALARALHRSKSLVKTWMMRGTIHYLDADDLPVWVSASATREAWRKPHWQKAFGLTERDVVKAIEAIGKALDGDPLTREALADEVHRRLRNKALDELMRAGWGSVLKIAAAKGLLCFGPSQGRNVTFVRPDRWLTGWRDVPRDESIVAVCRRYLASHGPATREEFARWWGFTPADARRVLQAMDSEVVQVDREGDKAFVLASDLDLLESAQEDARIRVLGMFDAYTLAGLPSDQIVPKSKKDLVYRTGAWVSQVVIRGGRVIGVWNHERSSKETRIEVSLFQKRNVSRRAVASAMEDLQPFLDRIATLRVS